MRVFCHLLLLAIVNADNYKLIARLKDVNIGLFSSSIKSDGNENPDDIEANTYSIIGRIGDNLASYQDDGGYYQFRLEFDNVDGSQSIIEWKQTSWIEESTIAGYTAINVPPQEECANDDGCEFRGLGQSSQAQTYLDGNADAHKSWWNSVGTIKLHVGGIPGFDRKVATSSSLYILEICPLSACDVDERVDAIVSQLNGLSVDGSIYDINNIYKKDLLFNDKEFKFVFSNTDILLLCMNVFTILFGVFGVFICWKNGLFDKKRKIVYYSKVKRIDSNSENDYINE